MKKNKKNCNVEIGKRLKRIRENMGLSQAQFAEILNITEDQYRRIENGVSGLTVEKIQFLFEKFHIDSNYLINGEEPDQFDLDAYLSACSTEQRDELITRCLEYISRFFKKDM